MAGPLGPQHAMAGPLPVAAVAAAAGATADVQIWINGVSQPPSGPHVAATDRGLTLADGLFETMRVHRGRVFRFDAHLSRLRSGLSVLRIEAPGAIESWVRQAVQASGRQSASVRLTVTRGVSPGGLAPSPLAIPTVIVTVGGLPAIPSSVYERGLHAHVPEGRRNERAMTASVKTLAYADAVLALLEARSRGMDEAIFLDTDGHCSEATASNLFARIGDRLLTPPVSCGALPGITRAAVLSLAGTLGLRPGEHVLSLDDLLAADEAFVTSSLRGIAPLVRVEGRPIGTGAPGTATGGLRDAYARLVEHECEA